MRALRRGGSGLSWWLVWVLWCVPAGKPRWQRYAVVAGLTIA